MRTDAVIGGEKSNPGRSIQVRGVRKQTNLLCGVKDSQESSMDLRAVIFFIIRRKA